MTGLQRVSIFEMGPKPDAPRLGYSSFLFSPRVFSAEKLPCWPPHVSGRMRHKGTPMIHKMQSSSSRSPQPLAPVPTIIFAPERGTHCAAFSIRSRPAIWWSAMAPSAAQRALPVNWDPTLRLVVVRILLGSDHSFDVDFGCENGFFITEAFAVGAISNSVPWSEGVSRRLELFASPCPEWP